MRKFITLLLFCGLSLTASATATPRNTREQTAARPNIILIMADDQAYETIGANGGTSYKTPNIDRLAANGIVSKMLTRIRSARRRASP